MLLGSAKGAQHEETIVLIANKQSSFASLSTESVRAIFAMRLRTFPGGRAAHVFVLPDNNPLHDVFCKQLLNVYPHQLRLAWDRAVFSGTGQAPNTVESISDMLDLVATTPGGIGYVKKGQADDRVRIISLD
ncbi:hypothetical protein [Larsenimonas salina]|uniref:hypothetical protein n=1 Tax=Larsenimonas salina TaxID=1295565 RepID=UPI002074314D|nr:hypothetical protein [Larsenimonas salina]MCM5704167.1 hypothetical protein [Larsenimonas salina]